MEKTLKGKTPTKDSLQRGVECLCKTAAEFPENRVGNSDEWTVCVRIVGEAWRKIGWTTGTELLYW